MLTHPTQDRLVTLGLTGMAKALEEQRMQPDIAALSFEERLALMVDREAIERDNKRLVSRLKFASLRQSAVVEDVDMKAPRGLDKALFARLVAGDWIARHQGLLICGPTGTGKSWLACALGHKACRDNRSVLYHRVPRLFDALALARGDGRHARLLKSLARVELLILDDWGLATLTPEQGRDILEIVEDRDTPLGEAVDAGIVKTPIIGRTKELIEQTHDDASYRYEAHLRLGYERWLRSCDEWIKSGRKPLLFVMCEDTDAADQITKRLNGDGVFAKLNGKTINLHTNLKGKINRRNRRESTRTGRKKPRRQDIQR